MRTIIIRLLSSVALDLDSRVIGIIFKMTEPVLSERIIKNNIPANQLYIIGWIMYEKCVYVLVFLFLKYFTCHKD